MQSSKIIEQQEIIHKTQAQKQPINMPIIIIAALFFIVVIACTVIYFYLKSKQVI